MIVSKLIEILESIEDKTLDVQIINRPCTKITYRGISQMFKSKNILGRPIVYIGDGQKEE